MTVVKNPDISFSDRNPYVHTTGRKWNAIEYDERLGYTAWHDEIRYDKGDVSRSASVIGTYPTLAKALAALAAAGYEVEGPGADWVDSAPPVSFWAFRWRASKYSRWQATAYEDRAVAERARAALDIDKYDVGPVREVVAALPLPEPPPPSIEGTVAPNPA